MSKVLDKPCEQDDFVKRWLVGLSERTKQNYLQQIHYWIVFVDLSPTEQIRKRMHDLTTEDISERQFFEDKFRAYKEYLENKGNLKPLAIKTQLTAVASFFSRNGLPLSLKRGDWENTQEQEIIQKPKITKEEVKAMYSHGNTRDRALLLVLSQSGFSEVDVSSFKIEKMKGAIHASRNRSLCYRKTKRKDRGNSSDLPTL